MNKKLTWKDRKTLQEHAENAGIAHSIRAKSAVRRACASQNAHQVVHGKQRKLSATRGGYVLAASV